MEVIDSLLVTDGGRGGEGEGGDFNKSAVGSGLSAYSLAYKIGSRSVY